jgi:hypothetical protein
MTQYRHRAAGLTIPYSPTVKTVPPGFDLYHGIDQKRILASGSSTLGPTIDIIWEFSQSNRIEFPMARGVAKQKLRQAENGLKVAITPRNR